MRGNITKTVKRTEIKGLFYDREAKEEIVRNVFVYTDVSAKTFSVEEAVCQNPGLIEIMEEVKTENVVIGMSMDKFLLFRESEKVKNK